MPYYLPPPFSGSSNWSFGSTSTGRGTATAKETITSRQTSSSPAGLPAAAKSIKIFNLKFSSETKNSIILGFKKAYSISLLPPKIEKFYSNIYVRILRVIGGICFLLTITKYFVLFPDFLHLFIFIFAIFQGVQIFILYLIKFCYGIYIIMYRPELYEVRNSPLNFMATHLGKILLCVKTGCQITGGAGTLIATGVAFDTVLEGAGQKKIFVPMMADAYKFIYDQVMPQDQMSSVLEKRNQFKQDENFKNALGSYSKLDENKKSEFLKMVKEEWDKASKDKN